MTPPTTIESYRSRRDEDAPSEGSVLLRPGAIVLVDMDNTVARLDTVLERRWVRRLPHIPKPNFSEIKRMKVQDVLTDKGQVAEIRKLMYEPGFFRSLPLIAGARQALQELRERGVNVFFCTAPMLGRSCPCASEKLDWLRDHFGEWAPEQCVITTDKTLVMGDVLIDDNPEIQGVMTPTWKHVYFHQPCNRPEALEAQSIPLEKRAVARLRRWSDWPQVLRLAPSP